jgi:fatty-acyl-CoA synthase
MRRVIGEMNIREMTICYGMTETSPVSFQSSVTDSVERRVSTVGRVHPHVEVKIVDANSNIVPRGTPGELLTRGYSVMQGYWGDPEHTASSIDRAGWMHTGDLATLDDEGFCNIVGRLKDIIVRGGENISPREIEEYLYTHPKIETVQIFGVPDEKYGEAVCAWIRLRTGEELDEAGLRKFCDGNIAHYKVPRYVRFVDEFPMTVTGKIQKFAMRDEMTRRLGLRKQQTA